MIVQPDFLDHWKTRMLVGILKDESAPLILIRLWSYCQQNRRWVITDIKEETLKVICRVENPRVSLTETLITCGFLKNKDGQIYVNDWEEYNSKLIAAWNNGEKGGRPKNPQVPVGSSDENRLDRSRVEGSGEEKKEGKKGPARSSQKTQKVYPRASKDEVVAFVVSEGLTQRDGEWLFLKWEESEWTKNDGKQPIKDWKLTVKSWNAAGYFPSQKNSKLNGNHSSNQIEDPFSAKTYAS